MPRRPEQFEEIREKSREKILAAALELFANKGYDATSIDSIAKKAGISKGLIYNYFESKKSILLAIFKEAISQGEQILHDQKGITDPYKRLKMIIEQVFDMIHQNPEYFKLFMVLSLQPIVMEDTKDIAKKMFKKSQKLVGSMFGESKENDPVKGMMLDALLDGIMLNYIRYGDQYPIDVLKDRIIEDYCTPKKKGR